MFISFDYRCDNVLCAARSIRRERLVKKAKQDHQHCPSCGTTMRRLPAAPKTTFRFADTKLKP